MKRLILLLPGLMVASFLSCGPTAEEKKKMDEQKLKSDMDTSIVNEAIEALAEPEKGDSAIKDSAKSY